MRSSKSRSRSKSNRNRSVGNIVNRVFDSSGPEGKVRGTPQQIIDKYSQLARDAALGNDRVAAENFQQHAEHYTRMLSEAQREQDARREQQEQQNRERQRDRDEGRPSRDGEQGGASGGDDRAERDRSDRDYAEKDRPERERSDQSERRSRGPRTPQPDQGSEPAPVLDGGAGEEGGGLVETPEGSGEKPAPKPRRTRKPKAAESSEPPTSDGEPAEKVE
jgi:hypothetical protein